MDSDVVLSVKLLCKSFRDNLVLNRVSFDLHRKEILGILGFSGEGKSTLLNIVCGICDYDSGRILYNFGDLKSSRKFFVRTKIGYSTQEPSFYDEMTVYENIEFFGKLLDVDKEKLKVRTRMLLDVLRLKNVEGKLGKDLSVGMKKRLDLACSLIHSPEILILDEPTANLDFSLREEFLSYIKEVREMGVSIIYVSHFLSEIEEISDRVVFLNKGRSRVVVNEGDVKSMFLEYVKGV